MERLEAQTAVNKTFGKYRLERAKQNLTAYAISSGSAIVAGALTGGLIVQVITKDSERAVKVAAVAAGYYEFIYLMFRTFTTDASSFSCNYQRLKEMRWSLKRGIINPLENVTLEDFLAQYELPSKQKKLGAYPTTK